MAFIDSPRRRRSWFIACVFEDSMKEAQVRLELRRSFIKPRKLSVFEYVSHTVVPNQLLLQIALYLSKILWIMCKLDFLLGILQCTF